MLRYRVARAARCVVLLLALLPAPAGAQELSSSIPLPSDDETGSLIPGTVTLAALQQPTEPTGDQQTETTTPTLDAVTELAGAWLSPGVVSLDWDDVAEADSYELTALVDDKWLLLDPGTAIDGVAVVVDGSSALIAGLPSDASAHWFAVRSRNIWSLSPWSHSAAVQVPESTLYSGSRASGFDPFTAAMHPRIDVERLREAATTIDALADCSAVPALAISGLTVVDPPSSLDDLPAALTVAEVARIADGCLIIEYVSLSGRTVADIRTLLATESTVHAVGTPLRGVSLEHDTNDPGFSHPMPAGTSSLDQTGHHNDGASAPYSQWHLTPDVTNLWDGWDPNTALTVAVIDTGVDETHPDLNGQLVTGGLPDCHRKDANGHGTHVTGIIAAKRGNGATFAGVAGVAPESTILPINFAHRAECERNMTATRAVAVAINAGARVINMSFKSDAERETTMIGGIDVDVPTEDSFMLALHVASMLGVVPITSVGNDGTDTDETGPINQKNAPATYDTVISVASINHADTDRQAPLRSAFSTANSLVDIAAPGETVLSTVPLRACKTEDADGRPIIGTYTPLGCGTDPGHSSCMGVSPTTLHLGSNIDPGRCARRVATTSGTSMAAPFVSGVVAHMLNRHPRADFGQVLEALQSSARSPVEQPMTPRGRAGDPSMPPPSKEFGFGIVQPAKAVEAL